MFEARGVQAGDIVAVPGEQGCPGAHAARVEVDNQVGIVHKPGGQGQLQPGQQVHEHALHVHAHVVERQAAVGAEFQYGPQQAAHKICLGHIAVAYGEKPVFQVQLAAGGFDFAHKKVAAGEQ